MQTGHGNVTVAVSIEDFEDTFHAANRNQFSVSIALFKRAKLAVKRQFCCWVNLLERLIKQIIQRMGSVFRFFRHWSNSR